MRPTLPRRPRPTPRRPPQGAVTRRRCDLWETIDHVVDHIFSDPPSPDAQVQVTFTYEGYRITVEQDGTTKLVDVE